MTIWNSTRVSLWLLVATQSAAASTRQLQTGIIEQPDCVDNGDVFRCELRSQLTIDNGSDDYRELVTTVTCPRDRSEGLNLQEVDGCECVTMVTSPEDPTHVDKYCACRICQADFGSNVLSVDCRSAVAVNATGPNPTLEILPGCEASDCTGSCGGGCLESCAVSGEACPALCPYDSLPGMAMPSTAPAAASRTMPPTVLSPSPTNVSVPVLVPVFPVSPTRAPTPMPVTSIATAGSGNCTIENGTAHCEVYQRVSDDNGSGYSSDLNMTVDCAYTNGAFDTDSCACTAVIRHDDPSRADKRCSCVLCVNAVLSSQIAVDCREPEPSEPGTTPDSIIFANCEAWDCLGQCGGSCGTTCETSGADCRLCDSSSPIFLATRPPVVAPTGRPTTLAPTLVPSSSPSTSAPVPVVIGTPTVGGTPGLTFGPPSTTGKTSLVTSAARSAIVAASLLLTSVMGMV